MAGYRCVNFADLCRLCSNATNNQTQIFSNEELKKKILECLPIQLDEKDKLPKGICSGCKEYVETFHDFRKSTQSTQKMLEGCLNSSKIRNGGQVYVKDEVPLKKVLKPIQNPSPTKIIPNLKLITTPPSQMKKNVIAAPTQNDYLSTIMQASGIQGGEENFSENNVTRPPPPPIQEIPQYTLTLDGNVIKSGQVQYKIENTGNVVGSEELLKLNQKPGLTVRKENPAQLRLTTANSAEEPKNKKPKINFIIQSPPSNQTQKQQPKVQTSQIIASSTPKATLTSPSKAQILNIEKIPPVTTQVSPTKQLLVPIMVQSDGTRNTLSANDATAQLIQQAIMSQVETKPPALNQKFMLMKIQSNADGQFTLMPATQLAPPLPPPPPQPQQLQLQLSSQQLQQLGLQALQPTASQLTIPTQIAQTTVTPALKQETQTTQTVKERALEEVQVEEEEIYEPNYEDNYYGDDNESLLDETLQEEEKAQDDKKFSSPKKKTVKFTKKSKQIETHEEPPINPEHSEIAKKQMAQITNYNAKRNPDESDAKSEINLTVCDVCKKVFKRKEFLMQHLKSHIGIRPFKCDEPTCNKSFSRKEHLLRHVSSHTGKKEYQCDVCNKMFSRKDNLNKHKRIHPESGEKNLRHSCPNCEEAFSYKAQLQKHLESCLVKNEANENAKIVKTTPQSRNVKIKDEKKEQKVIQEATQNQKVVQVQQQSQMTKINNEQPQQIILSLSQLSQQLNQQKNKPGANILTFPVVVNPDGTIVGSRDLQNINS